jgi:hypothetical protein
VPATGGVPLFLKKFVDLKRQFAEIACASVGWLMAHEGADAPVLGHQACAMAAFGTLFVQCNESGK